VCPRVLREVADRDVLPVAAEVGEAERAGVEDPQEAARATAMLDVRLPVRAGGREEEAGLGRDERREAVVDRLGEPAALLEALVGASRAHAKLHGLGRG
jgi:hypothetical protein